MAERVLAAMPSVRPSVMPISTESQNCQKGAGTEVNRVEYGSGAGGRRTHAVAWAAGAAAA
eukprot:7382543-Prymnesium_polylepis.1